MKVFVNEMNQERIAVAKRLGRPNGVPVHLSDQLNFLSGWLKLDCREYHLNPEVMLEAQLAFNRRFAGTGILGPNFGVAIEPSAFGAKVIFPPNDAPWVQPMINDIDALPRFVEDLPLPDPRFSGYIPLLLSTYFYMRRRLGEAVAPPLGVLGPIDLASLLVGTTNLLTAIKVFPDVVHHFLEKLTTFLIEQIHVRAEVCRANIEEVAVYDDTAGYMSVPDFREFVVPYIRRIYQSTAPNAIHLFHCDGPLGHVAELLPEMGVTVLYNFDPHTDLTFFKEKIGRRTCLIGNVLPLDIMRNGTPEQVVKECQRQVRIGAEGGSFVLGLGGELANGTPPENIDALLETARDFS